ncbi:LysR family transcriptional regulator [Sedimentibacter hydroxybenzoicus DSM 7310]|uniref:LysR family transcriptional regulator n=1 Tax=Sedimentibacter hydroxybenzoicus DSM 7310 TaxID=1123245 RepID=A0A974BHK5_SEDHY|nr:LysR family transcriptional regulator [Sedimentibacter hydroxybenzoicus]NYB72962.1 LysR family transcriptional regulator [Sedimentibacter hydroxybenzoicus DSM 7310]
MTFQQLEYFIEVARTKHFTQAAQNLYVSQPSLSHSIQVLERELGVPLFIRSSGKKVSLTSYGKAFLPYCKSMMKQLKDGQQILEQMHKPMSGVVTIAYSYVNCSSLIPEMFNRFYEENSYNDTSVQFIVNHEQAVFEQDVVSGKVDLAFACTKSFDGLETMPIYSQELVLMIPANHPLAHKEKLSLYDIKDEQLLHYYAGSNLYNWINEMFQMCSLKPSISTGFKDWSACISYVSLGLGLAISPRLPVDTNLISVVKIDHPMNHRNVYMLWSKAKELSPAAEHVRQYCIEYSSKHFNLLGE